MLSLTEYPPSFYHKVFDLFIKYFIVPLADREGFINDYSSDDDDGDPYCIVVSESNILTLEFYFYVPDYDYPHLGNSSDSALDNSIDHDLIISFNDEVKKLADRCMKCKAFL